MAQLFKGALRGLCVFHGHGLGDLAQQLMGLELVALQGQGDALGLTAFTQLVYGEANGHAHVQSQIALFGELAAGFLQNPVAQVVDHAKVLGQGNEDIGRDHAALGVVSAQQGFDTNDAPAFAVNLGLIVQQDLLALYGVTQVVLQLQLLGGIAAYVGLKDDKTIAAVAFGGIGIGIGNQVIR